MKIPHYQMSFYFFPKGSKHDCATSHVLLHLFQINVLCHALIIYLINDGKNQKEWNSSAIESRFSHYKWGDEPLLHPSLDIQNILIATNNPWLTPHSFLEKRKK